jgi:serine/threonine protein kinase
MHNDLKSANLLVDRAGSLKVCDFGMSRLHGRQNPEQELHSPAWMAPEVLRGDAYNASADVYSFGVVLWELATLQIPWEGFHRHGIRYWVVEKETHLPFVTEGDAIEGAAPALATVRLCLPCLVKVSYAAGLKRVVICVCCGAAPTTSV